MSQNNLSSEEDETFKQTATPSIFKEIITPITPIFQKRRGKIGSTESEKLYRNYIKQYTPKIGQEIYLSAFENPVTLLYKYGYKKTIPTDFIVLKDETNRLLHGYSYITINDMIYKIIKKNIDWGVEEIFKELDVVTNNNLDPKINKNKINLYLYLFFGDQNLNTSNLLLPSIIDRINLKSLSIKSQTFILTDYQRWLRIFDNLLKKDNKKFEIITNMFDKLDIFADIFIFAENKDFQSIIEKLPPILNRYIGENNTEWQKMAISIYFKYKTDKLMNKIVEKEEEKKGEELTEDEENRIRSKVGNEILDELDKILISVSRSNILLIIKNYDGKLDQWSKGNFNDQPSEKIFEVYKDIIEVLRKIDKDLFFTKFEAESSKIGGLVSWNKLKNVSQIPEILDIEPKYGLEIFNKSKADFNIPYIGLSIDESYHKLYYNVWDDFQLPSDLVIVHESKNQNLNKFYASVWVGKNDSERSVQEFYVPTTLDLVKGEIHFASFIKEKHINSLEKVIEDKTPLIFNNIYETGVNGNFQIYNVIFDHITFLDEITNNEFFGEFLYFEESHKASYDKNKINYHYTRFFIKKYLTSQNREEKHLGASRLNDEQLKTLRSTISVTIEQKWLMRNTKVSVRDVNTMRSGILDLVQDTFESTVEQDTFESTVQCSQHKKPFSKQKFTKSREPIIEDVENSFKRDTPYISLKISRALGRMDASQFQLILSILLYRYTINIDNILDTYEEINDPGTGSLEIPLIEYIENLRKSTQDTGDDAVSKILDTDESSFILNGISEYVTNKKFRKLFYSVKNGYARGCTKDRQPEIVSKSIAEEYYKNHNKFILPYPAIKNKQYKLTKYGPGNEKTPFEYYNGKNEPPLFFAVCTNDDWDFPGVKQESSKITSCMDIEGKKIFLPC